MATLPELRGWLAEHYDVNDLVEILDISSEELVYMFSDKIEDRMDTLMELIDDDESDQI